MSDQTKMQPIAPVARVDILREFASGELEDLCDATEAAIKGGGGFGWLEVPQRQVMERYWQGVLAMPSRTLFVARLDNVICGTCQIVEPPRNNEAQAHAVDLTTNFVAPWARGHGLAHLILKEAERQAKEEGFSVINLSVRETMGAAIKLYEELGYIRCGMHPHYAEVDGQPVKGFYYYKVI